MEERQVQARRALVAHHEPSERPVPGERALDDPPPFVPAELASVLTRCPNPVSTMGRNQINLSSRKIVAQEVRNGILSADDARHIYGVEIEDG